MKKEMIELTCADVSYANETFLADPGSVVLVEKTTGETIVTFSTGEKRSVRESYEKVRQLVEPPRMVGR